MRIEEMDAIGDDAQVNAVAVVERVIGMDRGNGHPRGGREMDVGLVAERLHHLHRRGEGERIGRVEGLSKIMARLDMGEGDESPGHAAAALEFTLEGLYLMRRLSKDETDGTAVYRT